MKAKFTCPAVERKSAWPVRSEHRDSRLLLVRSGEKQAGGTYTQQDRVNFRFTLPGSLPDDVRKPLQQYTANYRNLITVQDGHGQITQAPATTPATSVMVKRPAAATSRPTSSASATRGIKKTKVVKSMRSKTVKGMKSKTTKKQK